MSSLLELVLKKWLLSAALVGFSVVPSPSVEAVSIEQQRATYKKAIAYQQAKKWGKAAKLRQKLDAYPLALFLDYNFLNRELAQRSIKEVENFTKDHADSPLANNLERRYLFSLANRQRWQDFLNFYPKEPNNTELQCHYYVAKLNTGDRAAGLKGAEKLWMTGQSRPNACDHLFSSYKKAGKLTQEHIWQRMLLSFDRGQRQLLDYLSRQLDKKHKDHGTLLLATYLKPEELLKYPKYTSTSPYISQVIAVGLKRLTKKNPRDALKAYQEYANSVSFSDEENRAIKYQLIRYLMFRKADKQMDWVDENLLSLADEGLMEQRIRYALKEKDWEKTSFWVDRLPNELKGKDRWRYWQARIFEEMGQDKLAARELDELAKDRSFYGFLSAQKVGVDYQLNQKEISENQKVPGLYQDQLARISELIHIEADYQVRLEWVFLLRGKSKETQNQLALYALKQGWDHLSILGSIESKSWDHLTLRFPRVEPKTFERYAKERQIDVSLLFALARQESALYPKAKSHVGARGLMQLMPATAKYTAKKIGFKYQGTHQLYEPEVNVKLGSAYLKELMDQYDGNRIFASAAYNAGPHRVKRWRANSEGVAMDVWVETIPFKETRQYVKNVLAFNVIYQHFLDKPMQMVTEKEHTAVY